MHSKNVFTLCVLKETGKSWLTEMKVRVIESGLEVISHISSSFGVQLEPKVHETGTIVTIVFKVTQTSLTQGPCFWKKKCWLDQCCNGKSIWASYGYPVVQGPLIEKTMDFPMLCRTIFALDEVHIVKWLVLASLLL